MQSLADDLPPEVARFVHADWRKNEADYWAMRETLLAQYRNQWVAFARGAVIASGVSPVEVFHEAQLSGLHPYVTCVGRELEPSRMRRAVFAYDKTYPVEPLPLLSVEVRMEPNTAGIMFDRVIPDTGADASAFPWTDCQRLHLDPSQGVPGLMGGVAQSSAATLVFSVWVHLDGANYRCRLQADFSGDERILGRDVLNRLEILFDGPSGQIVLNP
jgi:hypothetical protein